MCSALINSSCHSRVRLVSMFREMYQWQYHIVPKKHIHNCHCSNRLTVKCTYQWQHHMVPKQTHCQRLKAHIAWLWNVPRQHHVVPNQAYHQSSHSLAAKCKAAPYRTQHASIRLCLARLRNVPTAAPFYAQHEYTALVPMAALIIWNI